MGALQHDAEQGRGISLAPGVPLPKKGSGSCPAALQHLKDQQDEGSACPSILRSKKQRGHLLKSVDVFPQDWQCKMHAEPRAPQELPGVSHLHPSAPERGHFLKAHFAGEKPRHPRPPKRDDR